MTPSSTLRDPKVVEVLTRLHHEAGRQRLGIARALGLVLLDGLLGRQPEPAAEAARIRRMLLCISTKQGHLAYALARSARARCIVEFGTSFGVSTIYLAAAVRDNGGGRVIGTELEPGKVAKAQAHLEEAGLGDLVDVRQGHALETLNDLRAPIDFLLLDGFKQFYLPVLELVAPKLRPGALVFADNVHTFRRALGSYLAYVRNPDGPFASVTLHLGDGTEISTRL